jgi:hypothetical protein
MSLIMRRIDSSSPPGVSICSTTRRAPRPWARARLRLKKSALAGPMIPSSFSTRTGFAVPDSALIPSPHSPIDSRASEATSRKRSFKVDTAEFLATTRADSILRRLPASCWQRE